MKIIPLVRYLDTGAETQGIMIVESRVIHTIEEPWKNNEKKISCIPNGLYSVKKLPVSPSGRFRNVFHVLDVSGRTGIFIHEGNTTLDIEGCILVGLRQGELSEKAAVLDSRLALAFLNEKLPDNFLLDIKYLK